MTLLTHTGRTLTTAGASGAYIVTYLSVMSSNSILYFEFALYRAVQLRHWQTYTVNEPSNYQADEI